MTAAFGPAPRACRDCGHEEDDATAELCSACRVGELRALVCGTCGEEVEDDRLESWRDRCERAEVRGWRRPGLECGTCKREREEAQSEDAFYARRERARGGER